MVGEHSVIFAGPAERIELVHRAVDRMIFARGALHAAAWARGQKPGPLFDGRRAGTEGFLSGNAWHLRTSPFQGGGERRGEALRTSVGRQFPRSSDAPVISLGFGRSISSSSVGAMSASRPSAKSARLPAPSSTIGHRVGGVRRVRAAG